MEYSKVLEQYKDLNYTISKVCKLENIEKDSFIEWLQANNFRLATSGMNHIRNVFYIQIAAEEYTKNCANTTAEKLALKYRINAQSLRNYINKYYTLETFNSAVFDVIDSEEKAYWLGFIFADGYINNYASHPNHGYGFELSLQLSDIKHLEKFNKFISNKCCVKSDNFRCRVCLHSKHLWETLNNLGCTPCKSLTLKFPTNIPQTLIKHFIRGYWDGDGCLTYKRANYPTISVLGTEQFLNSVQSFFNTSCNLYNNSKTNNITKVLKYNGKLAFDITHELYGNASVYLDRKYSKYLEYCRLYQKQY